MQHEQPQNERWTIVNTDIPKAFLQGATCNELAELQEQANLPDEPRQATTEEPTATATSLTQANLATHETYNISTPSSSGPGSLKSSTIPAEDNQRLQEVESEPDSEDDLADIARNVAKLAQARNEESEIQQAERYRKHIED